MPFSSSFFNKAIINNTKKEGRKCFIKGRIQHILFCAYIVSEIIIKNSFPITSKIFYMHHPTDRMVHTLAFITQIVEHWLAHGTAQLIHIEGSIWRPTVTMSGLYRWGPLPYVWRHITVNKNLLSASLNKTFPSFLSLDYVTLVRSSSSLLL